MNENRLSGRTPQRPPPGSSVMPGTSTTRSRTSVSTAADVSSTSTLTGVRANARTKAPKVTPRSNNTGSPRTPPSTRKPSTPSRDAPETDEDRDSVDSAQSEWLRQSSEALASMDRQIQDAAKRNKKHQIRCTTMRDAISGKEERMDMLRGTYASLNREVDELNLLSGNEDLDAEILNDMFMAIPMEERCILTD